MIGLLELVVLAANSTKIIASLDGVRRIPGAVVFPHPFMYTPPLPPPRTVVMGSELET
ncbi:hypothetical protein [Citricoccus sp. CH26A]|uniref:hypothetical protein n=1 Tax=Citricoccus TaxID=169133 RepID=UPI00178C4E06|nr:hypothetical protein [Citricoccus sp. CH26A]